MLILGLESSCDETACAIVENGSRVLSGVISSQVKAHSPYGGVVPELASRLHVEKIIPVIDKCLDEAGLRLEDMDAFSVTAGPGLIGSLLVGMETAKSIAYVMKKPLAPVHHIAAHLYTPFLDFPGNEVPEDFDYPYLGLVVSGGHSSLILVRDSLTYERIGRTLDDAAGEAFDKVAKLLELGYPGGPVIDRLSEFGNPEHVRFPRPGSKSDKPDLSFSGLKTAVVRHVRNGKATGEVAEDSVEDLAASFQAAVIDTLVEKTRRALQVTGVRRLAVVGGVACNRSLRKAIASAYNGIDLHIPPPALCTDNAYMIAGLGYHVLKSGVKAPLDLNADAGLDLLKPVLFK